MNQQNNTRHLSFEEAVTLRPGSEHYRAYVGPPDQYDFMGATQFRLLCALGLRDTHTVLDFGCGSLRAGRLLIPYLRANRYFGLDPNRWLIEDAVKHEIGHDLVALKQPMFRYDTDFTADHFGTQFDFIVAQSIFSHAGSDLIGTTLRSFKRTLRSGGLVLATFIQPHQLGVTESFSGHGWIYPGCVAYYPQTFTAFASNAGMVGRLIPWFHPRQTWIVMAHRSADLPSAEHDQHLTGAVLRDQQLAASVAG